MNITVPFMTVLQLVITEAFCSEGKSLGTSDLGVLTWLVTNDTVANVKTLEDGTVYLVPTGKPGTVGVTVQGDSDPNTPMSFSGSLIVTYEKEEVAVVTIAATVAQLPVTPVEVASVEVASVEVASVEVPQLEVPQLEVPQLEVPQLEVPQLEVPQVP